MILAIRAGDKKHSQMDYNAFTEQIIIMNNNYNFNLFKFSFSLKYVNCKTLQTIVKYLPHSFEFFTKSSFMCPKEKKETTVCSHLSNPNREPLSNP